MTKYRAITPIKTADGKVYQANSIVELTDAEAKNCLRFKAVVPIPEAPKPVQPIVAPIMQNTSATQVQPDPVISQETVSTDGDVVPPESDVR